MVVSSLLPPSLRMFLTDVSPTLATSSSPTRDRSEDDNHPEAYDVKHEIDVGTVRRDLFRFLLWCAGAFSGDEQPMVVDAVWRAGQKGHEIPT